MAKDNDKEKADFLVTPWEVKGIVDYERLIEEFGTEKISEEILDLIKSYAGELHPLLIRKIFFSHRDLKWLFAEFEKGNQFFLYTGRGPSGNTHLGHLMPWIFTKWLQDKFECELWFQMTDDEKFYFNPQLSLEDTHNFAYENALDVIALGFDPKKTFIFSDIDIAGVLYPQAARVAKRITFSTAKATFGFKNEANLGQIFFTSMQAVPAFLPSVLRKKKIPCLIPHAIDQDPHFRVARDVIPKLGYYKPASIHCIFLPGLKEGGKMSASIKESAIFTTDTPKEVQKKIGNAFTGGRPTLKEQRELGGNPEVCSVYKYYFCLFLWDDKKLMARRNKCVNGEIMCGECKKYLIELVLKFLKEHQRKREAARAHVGDFFVSYEDLRSGNI
ncbi:MAG: tryptophan--tRNA ligase [Candidatus Helarchaeota archaeon]